MGKWMIIFLIIPIFSFSITAEEIVRAIDKNMVFDTEKASAAMTINREGKKLVKTMTMVGEKRGSGNEFFLVFTNPEDRGVKYLKIDNELWIYLPDADDILKISGHMLRQGMMGSDISYEDMMRDEDYWTRYSSVLQGETNINDVKCYDIVLTARVQDVTYYKERLVVDEEKMVALERDLYAKSGRLLKIFSQGGIQSFNGRYYPTFITVRDMTRENSITTVELSGIEFDVKLPDGVFSKQNLKK
jgi:outer membrane lipoprotein-sorting protein